MIKRHMTNLGSAYPDASDPPRVRELDSRVSDGLQVDLLWSDRKGRAWVAVADSRTGAEFTVPVRAGESPLDVFYHPYAYAASHGVDTMPTPAGPESDTALAA